MIGNNPRNARPAAPTPAPIEWANLIQAVAPALLATAQSIRRQPTTTARPPPTNWAAGGYHGPNHAQHPIVGVRTPKTAPTDHQKHDIAAGKTAPPTAGASSHNKRGGHEKEGFFLTATIAVLAALAATGYFATTVYNFRPVDKVLDPDIQHMHDAWATRTAPGQPTLAPHHYIDEVTIYVRSDHPNSLRKAEKWLIDNGHGPIRGSEGYKSHIRFYLPENEVLPLAHQLARRPRINSVGISAGPPSPHLNARNCPSRLAQEIRQNPRINASQDAHHILDYLAADDPGCTLPWSNPKVHPTADLCHIDNPRLNIHLRAFYKTLLESYNGIDPIIRDDKGNILIPLTGTYSTQCAMYHAREKKWFNVDPLHHSPQ